MSDPATRPKIIVILGASPNPARISNTLLRRLAGRDDYRAIPVRPAVPMIEGVLAHASLDSVAGDPDVLTVYVNAVRSSVLEPGILRLRPRKVIFNPGAENAALEARLNRAGIATENACSLILLSRNAL